MDFEMMDFEDLKMKRKKAEARAREAGNEK